MAVLNRPHLVLLALSFGGCGTEGSGTLDVEESSAAHETQAGETRDAAPIEESELAGDGGDVGQLADGEALVVPSARAPGERAPLTARCDESEPGRCFLPWPSSAFLALDVTRATGVRLALAPDVLPGEEGVEYLEGADGFSRVSPIVTLLPAGADPTGVAMRVFVAEPGASFGTEIPIDSVVVPGRDAADRASIVGYPLAPLRAASEHIVIVEGSPALSTMAGGEASARAAAVALGEVAPESQAEAARFAYFAPARALLADKGVASDRVFALWDFVTRSAEDARRPLRALADDARAQIDDGSASVTVTSAAPGRGPIALVVEGQVDGLVDHSTGDLTYAAPFRVVVPAGEGDYRIVMYGHGTAGNVHDTAFDELIARSGAAKINTETDGWTDDTVTSALTSLLVPIAGTRDLTRRMRRSIAGIAAIQRAAIGPLGDLLAAPTILGQPNPAAARRPSADLPIWAGGSLGGVIGFVYGHLEPTIAGGILNVPGAAFTHWLARSSIGAVLDLALASRYPEMVDQQLVAAMAQTLWDEVDGAIWAGARTPAPIFAVQMSVGDPIMPNNATAMVATALDALMLVPDGATPILPVSGLERASEAIGRSALTEFVTSETGNSAIHGFAARNAPAGLAAREQIEAFIASLWAGAPIIRIPEACGALPVSGLCDFSSPPP